MSIWRELREFAERTTWLERAFLIYALVMAVVKARRGDWSHAATYLLVGCWVASSAVWRQSSEYWKSRRDVWRGMFYDLRDRRRRTL